MAKVHRKLRGALGTPQAAWPWKGTAPRCPYQWCCIRWGSLGDSVGNTRFGYRCSRRGTTRENIIWGHSERNEDGRKEIQKQWKGELRSRKGEVRCVNHRFAAVLGPLPGTVTTAAQMRRTNTACGHAHTKCHNCFCGHEPGKGACCPGSSWLGHPATPVPVPSPGLAALTYLPLLHGRLLISSS